MTGVVRLTALVACLGLGACASQTMPQPGQEGGVDRAIQQPMRDLSLIREQAPEVLGRAVANPYDVSRLATCADVAHEIADLDAALGPDLRPGGEKAKGLISGDSLASDLVGGAVGLPFRGVVRAVTGADARDRRLHAAILAGMVRRGFLKGRLGEMVCLPPPPKS